MSLSIASNIVSLLAQRRLNDNSSQLSRVFERLASGQRINRASDDAAGLALSESLRADARIYSQAVRNANDGISMLSIADGALNALADVLQRQQELAQQAANGSLSNEQRNALQQESIQLTEEYNRIIESTEFNGINVIEGDSGEITLQVGVGDGSTIELTLGEDLSRTAGTGTFEDAITQTASTSADTVLVGDFNGDGRDDFVAIDPGDTELIYMESNGDGTFTETVVDSTGQKDGVAIGDFDGDGNLDIATGIELGGNGQVHFYKGDGSGGFAAEEASGAFVDGTPESLFATDYDGDGIDELISIEGDGQFRVISYASGTGFEIGELQSIDVDGSRAEMYDVNGDGILDIVGSATDFSTNNVYLGSSNGTFQKAGSFGDASVANNFRFADVNLDGNIDVIYANFLNKTLDLALGDGSGNFGSETSIATQSSQLTGGDAEFADINNDGFVDLIAMSDTDDTIEVLLGDGTGSFTTSSLTTGALLSELAVGDFNGDGVVDLVHHGNNTQFGVLLANTTQTNTLAQINISTQEEAQASLSMLDEAIAKLNEERSNIGSSLSRLSFTINTLQSARDNFLEARSRIMDADIAQETAELIRLQVLQDATTAILAQANLQSELVLDLLR